MASSSEMGEPPSPDGSQTWFGSRFAGEPPPPQNHARMENLDLSQAEGMPILARIVVPLMAVEREAIGEVRGMSRVLPGAVASRRPRGAGGAHGGRLGRLVRREGRRDLAIGGGGGGARRRRGGGAGTRLSGSGDGGARRPDGGGPPGGGG